MIGLTLPHSERMDLVIRFPFDNVPIIIMSRFVSDRVLYLTICRAKFDKTELLPTPSSPLTTMRSIQIEVMSLRKIRIDQTQM